MEKYLSNAVDKYCGIAHVERTRLKPVCTPFLDEPQDPQGCASTAQDDDEEEDGKTKSFPVAAAFKKRRRKQGGRKIPCTRLLQVY